MNYLMKCGHVATAITQIGEPVCPICTCFDVEREVSGNMGLEGRKATCGTCGYCTDSSWTLAFFEYCPDKEYDHYYCGCHGWD